MRFHLASLHSLRCIQRQTLCSDRLSSNHQPLQQTELRMLLPQLSSIIVLGLDSISLSYCLGCTLKQKAGVTWGITTHISLLLRITFLHCLFYNVWKVLFSMFCPPLNLFMVEGLVWYKLLHCGHSQKSFDFLDILLQALSESNEPSS